MGQAQAAARQQQRVEELCAAAIRALSGERDLHFRGRRLHRGRTRLPLFAPHLHPSLAADDFASFRGAADGLALRLARSDAERHRTLAPVHPVARLVFGMLEQFRVESLAAGVWPGVRRNLRHRFEQWSLALHHAGLTESARGILLYTVAQIGRARVTAQPVVEAIEDFIEATRGALAPVLGTDLAGLRRERFDQAAYAVHALAIAATIAQMIDSADLEEAQERNGNDRDVDERLVFGLLMDVEQGNEHDPTATAAIGRSRVLDDAADGYRVFTTAHDRELRAGSLVRPALLDDYRRQLDRRIAGQGLNLARLARDLKALLATPSRDDWASAQEQGLIDGRRLAQLIVSPTERRLFRSELREPEADCVVTFLVDCSGSMREHIEAVAMLVDLFARALEMAGVANEVLGFTTGAWNGGRAMRDWLRAGRPAHPGRLNEAQHLIFKDGDTRWQRARRDIAALLKADLFREGIDGEALAWAARRLHQRGEARRVLIMVSDGCPMDAATQRANDPHYLDQHLREVAQGIEAEGAIELYALGVGLDLSAYYGRCQAIDLSAGLDNTVLREIVSMLARSGHR